MRLQHLRSRFVVVILPLPIKDTMLVAHKYCGGRSKAAGIIFVHYLSCLPTLGDKMENVAIRVFSDILWTL